MAECMQHASILSVHNTWNEASGRSRQLIGVRADGGGPRSANLIYSDVKPLAKAPEAA